MNDDLTCPSCRDLLPFNPELWEQLDPVMARNALSRHDNQTHVCNVCGLAEALAAFAGIPVGDARANAAELVRRMDL